MEKQTKNIDKDNKNNKKEPMKKLMYKVINRLYDSNAARTSIMIGSRFMVWGLMIAMPMALQAEPGKEMEKVKGAIGIGIMAFMLFVFGMGVIKLVSGIKNINKDEDAKMDIFIGLALGAAPFLAQFAWNKIFDGNKDLQFEGELFKSDNK